MSKTLAGTLFIRNGEQFDYCYKEAIQCLLEFCDHVYVCDAGSNDGTSEILETIESSKLTILRRDNEEWEGKQGREKLNYFTNIAIEQAEEDGFEYQFNLQADEIVTPDSYEFIRLAIAEGKEAYLCRRINLWASPYLQLNVPHHRKPCSTEIIRLTKTAYRSYGDAESVAAPFVDNYTSLIKIFHMGFVRSRDKMVDKCVHIQRDVFLIDPDKKLEGMTTFDPSKWFDKADLIPIEQSLPPLIEEWAKQRYCPDN